MQLVVVRGAERYSEFVADLASHGAQLCEAQMMRLRRRPGADEARLRGDEAQMLPVAQPFRLADRQRRLFARWLQVRQAVRGTGW